MLGGGWLRPSRLSVPSRVPAPVRIKMGPRGRTRRREWRWDVKHLNLAEWIELANSPIVGEVDRLPKLVKAAELQDVAQAFAHNCLRLFRLTPLLTNLFEAGKRGQLEISLRHVESTRPAIHPAHYPALHQPAQIGNRPPVPSGLPFESMTVYSAYLPLDATAVQTALEGLGDPAATGTVELLISMQVIGAWTAFETLAADLWERCLNARPELGFVALGADQQSGDTDEERNRKDRLKFELPVWKLRRWGFDLRTHMGTLMRGKWDFANRIETREAYAAVFGDNHGAELDKVFKDPQLNWLSAVRNVIVHNAGIADAEFERKVKKHPILSKLSADKRDPVVIDGILCRQLVGAGCECSLALFRFVDEWMENNK